MLSFSTQHGAIPRRRGVSLISRLPVTLRRRAKCLALSFNYNSGLPLLRGLVGKPLVADTDHVCNNLVPCRSSIDTFGGMADECRAGVINQGARVRQGV